MNPFSCMLISASIIALCPSRAHFERDPAQVLAIHERLGLALFFDEKTRTVKTGDGRVIPPLSYDSVVPQMG